MIEVRQAESRDVEAIREIYLATYGVDYPYTQFYDTESLRGMIYGEDNLLLVAEDSASKRVVGTASVVMDISAHADLVGEFGRLAVHPDCRGHGVGKLLMKGRIDRVRDRLHLGIADNRVAHRFSQRISEHHGFRPMGFVPMKLLVREREHIAVFGRFFSSALQLRRNNPHVIPEIHPLASLSLDCFQLPCDCIVDDSSEPFPHDSDYSVDDLTTAGYTSLLRIERGRVRNRDVFGPLRLHYGLFKLRARHSNYLLARRNGRVVGAIGFTVDKFEKAARVFELISSTDEVVRFLLSTLLTRSRYELNVEYVDIDVSANAPRLQRTLLELGFAPAAYVPAMVFNDIERVDAVKMVRLLVPFRFGKMDYTEGVRPFAELVLRDFQSRSVLPRVNDAIRWVRLFVGLSSEQVRRICESSEVRTYESGVVLFGEGESADRLQVVLSGEVGLSIAGRSLASVGRGQCLAERVLLDPTKEVTHQMTARTRNAVETLDLDRQKLVTLIRRRPDIGVVLYRNIASDVSEKLGEQDRRLSKAQASQ